MPSIPTTTTASKRGRSPSPTPAAAAASADTVAPKRHRRTPKPSCAATPAAASTGVDFPESDEGASADNADSDDSEDENDGDDGDAMDVDPEVPADHATRAVGGIAHWEVDRNAIAIAAQYGSVGETDEARMTAIALRVYDMFAGWYAGGFIGDRGMLVVTEAAVRISAQHYLLGAHRIATAINHFLDECKKAKRGPKRALKVRQFCPMPIAHFSMCKATITKSALVDMYKIMLRAKETEPRFRGIKLLSLEMFKRLGTPAAQWRYLLYRPDRSTTSDGTPTSYKGPTFRGVLSTDGTKCCLLMDVPGPAATTTSGRGRGGRRGRRGTQSEPTTEPATTTPAEPDRAATATTITPGRGRGGGCGRGRWSPRWRVSWARGLTRKRRSQWP
ncbi:hypothetical protein BC828DRAFT_415623, partial [Blastocladiella britannica]